MKAYKAIPEYYDAENERHAMLHEDVSFFLGQLPKRRQSVLELAVGTARAAIPIAQAGHRVLGVDYDDRMLQIAQRKRDAVGLRESQLRLLQGDILELNLRRRFDWICLFFNTFLAFTTLADQDRVLQCVRRHLKPRGRFWLDIFQPNLALLAANTSNDMDSCTFYVPRYERTVFMSTDVRRDPSRQVQRVTFNYKWFRPDGTAKHERRQFDITFIFPRELQILLERNGLYIERLFGNYDASPLNSDSPRMIARCRLG